MGRTPRSSTGECSPHLVRAGYWAKPDLPFDVARKA
jgi:hypothetical protein